jgi:glycosyltransferase involved in cell wall biosynthesis
MKSMPPFFSVIVPTRDRPGPLAGCLGSLGRLAYPPERFEVIVVDDGSERAPEEVVAPFRDRLSLTLIVQAKGGPAAARNAGARGARGEFLAFTDDDCKPDPGWLGALAERFQSAGDRALGGRTLNGCLDNLCAVATQSLMEDLYAHYNADPDAALFFTSNNLAVPAGPFRALGGFDPAFAEAAGEDRDFCDRWLRRGYGMTYVPGACVTHAHPLGFGGFWRKHFRYGRGAVRFHASRSARAPERTRLEPVSFYLGLLAGPWRRARSGRQVALAMLRAVSQAAQVAGYAWETASRDQDRARPPDTFP